MSELKPCPFCGGSNVRQGYVWASIDEKRSYDGGYADCLDCEYVQVGIEAWNTRHNPHADLLRECEPIVRWYIGVKEGTVGLTPEESRLLPRLEEALK